MQSMYAIIVAIVAYFGIQMWDDEKAKKEGRELASTAKRVMLFFILTMVSLIGGHLISGGWSDGKKTGGHVHAGIEIPHNDIWKRIPEEVHVGPPPF